MILLLKIQIDWNET